MSYDPKTGKVAMRRGLPPEYFGEGIVDWGPYILEWTWKSQVCFVYDRLTLQPVTQFTYTGEGWGMTRTATELIHQRWLGNATLPRSQHVPGNPPHSGKRQWKNYR